MSREIDSRVVEMQFDNKQFERNVSATMSSIDKLKENLKFKGADKGFDSVKTASSKLQDGLKDTASQTDKLKQSLQLKGATAGLEAVQSAAHKCDITPLGSAVDKISLKFSALQVMAATALSDITHQATNAAKRISSAFTIDPIKTGFQEYETQIGAVQTILANTSSKGTTLQDVNSALDILNTYADKTIYNFTEMTRNIGTFTAAGIDLDKSVSSIQGIANLAAVSGSTSQQASTAMYQLSQALASGTVKLMDWNSVVNAGMGGQVFQDALKRTAKNMGTNVDAIIKKNGSFRESLQEGWITADVLTKTLEQFTMAAEEGTDQWNKYKKSLMDDGYTEKQAIEILNMANTATEAATKVKTFTQLWDTLKESAQSGWTQTWEIIIGDFGEAKEFLTHISDTIGPMIGAAADARNELLSGGLSTGWKQLLGAGIADEVGFIDSIKAVAKEHNVTIDEMIEKEQGFDAALAAGLKNGSVSSEMLTKSVTNLADKMRNMTDAEREAAGYTAEHIKQIETLETGLKDGSISMDEFTKKMMRPSGRENLIQALQNAFDGLMSVIKPVKEAFSEIFPPATSEQLYELTEKIKSFSEKLIIGEETAKKLKNTFKGVFSIAKVGITIIKEVVSGVSKLLGPILGLGDSALSITEKIGNCLSEFSKFIENTSIIGETIKFVTSAIEMALSALKAFFGFIGKKISMPGLSGLTEIFNGMAEAMKSVVDLGQKFAKDFVDKFNAAFSSGEMSSGVKGWLDVLNTTLIGGILKSVKDWMGSIGDFTKSFSGAAKTFVESLGGLKEYLKALTVEVKAQALMKIAVAVGILAASVFLLASIDPKSLASALVGVLALFKTVMLSIKKLNVNATMKSMLGVTKVTTAMIALSFAILILASAVKKLSSLNIKELAIGLAGVIVLTQVMVRATKKLAESGKGFGKGAIQMVAIAFAIKILASACAEISKLSVPELVKGVVGVGVLLLEFVGFQKLMEKVDGKKMLSSAITITIIGKAMEIFADVANKFGQMNWTALGKAGSAITVILGLAIGFGALSKYVEKVTSGSFALIIIGVAMEIFANVCSKFGSMEWESLGKAGAAMGGILALAIGFGVLSKYTSNMTNAIIGLTIIGVAMEIFANVCSKFGSMEWESLGKAGAAVTGILGLAIGFGVLAKFAPDMLKASAALLVMSVALRLFTPVIETLGSMSVGGLVKGIAALAAVFVVLGLAAKLLTPVIPALYKLSGAIALVGAGCLMMGVGITLFAAGLASLATSVVAVAVGIISALEILLTGIVGLIPSLATSLGGVIVGICDAIASSATSIGGAIKAIVLTLVDVLIQCLPAITNGLLQLLVSVMTGLVQYTPQLVGLLFDFLIGILNSMAEKLPELIQAGVNLMMSFFQGVVDALASVDMTTLVQGLKGVGLFAGIIIALSAITPFIPGAMLAVIGMGVLVAELGLVLAAIGALAQIPGLEWLISEGGSFLQTVGTAIGQFLGGIVGGFAQGMSASLPQIGADLSAFMVNATPFIVGAKMIDATMLEGVKTLAEIMLLLTGASLLESITSWLTGGSSMADFGAQLAEFGPHIASFSESVKDINPEAITAAANAGKALAEMADTIPSDWGNNNLTNFAEQFVDYGGKIVDFSDAVSGKLDVDGINKAVDVGKKLTEMADTIPTDWNHNNLTNFGTQLASFGKNLVSFSDSVSGKSAGISGSIAPIKELITALSEISSDSATTLSTVTTTLTTAGTNAVNGFVKAFEDGGAKAKNAVNELVKAAVDKIKSDDNYNKFKAAGKYCAQGFANGIDNNKYLAGGAGTRLGNYAYQKAKEAIDSNSPSKKFAELGLYSVLGFAKGITDNLGDARKSAVGLGEAVLTATQDYLGIHSPSLVFDKEVGRYIVQGIANGIKEETAAEKAAKEKADKILSAFKDAFQKEFDKYDTGKNIAEGELELWTLLNPQATDDEIYKKQLSVYTEDLARQNHLAKLAHDRWRQAEDLFRQRLMSEDEVNKFYDEYVTQQITAAKAADKVIQLKNDTYDSAIEAIESDQSLDDAEWEFWKSANKDVSDEEYDRQYERYIRGKIARLRKKQDIYIEAMHEAVRIYGEGSAEANAAKQKCAENAKLINEAFDKVNQIPINRAKEQRETFEELQNIAISNNDTLYQIWEKTLGRDASDEEKEARKLTSLTTKASYQTQLLDSARKAWLDAKSEFGEGSTEEQKAYQDYLNAELNLVNTQSDILDVQESIADRQKRAADKQKLARSAYEDYIKKYKKYYQENGMSLEDLERDAKLVSGYDPTASVDTIVEKTNQAVSSVSSNPAYASSISGFTSMGASYVDAVNEGVTTQSSTLKETIGTMLTECAGVVSEYHQTWIDAGTNLMKNFIDGLLAQETAMVDTGIQLATTTLDAIQRTIDSQPNPTITPVLDLSVAEAQVARLHSMVSTAQAMGISASIAGNARTEIQNGVKKSNNGNTYNYVQNNYSPKALSDTEIYRQTKTLLAIKKGELS